MADIAKRYLITGAKGCIGAWVVKNLVESGNSPVLFDLDHKSSRLSLLLKEEQVRVIDFVQGDISSFEDVDRAVTQHGITHVIHLAGLQVPFCAADPVRGARVNVIGMLNVFESAKRHRDQVRKIVYASSCAVFGPPEHYGTKTISADVPHYPLTHYGAYKDCNEANARVYFLNDGISSVGLRPWAVYGVGRDQGKSSGPSKAIKAAVVGRKFTIPFTGWVDLHYADDVAKIFIRAAEHGIDGALLYSPRGSVIQVDEYLKTLSKILPAASELIDARGGTQQVAYDIDDPSLVRDLGPLPQTSLESGIRQTAEIFEILKRENRLDVSDLEA
jgi:nucleoside-diphosphate-sugar epimerase